MPTRSTRRAVGRNSRPGNGRGAHSGRGRAEEFTAAALDLFARRNFALVTIKDIASAIGANTALIYYYFDSKEDLFKAAVEAAVNRAFTHFRQLRAHSADPAAVINDWIDNHVDQFDPIHKLVKISLDYAGSGMRSPAIDRSIQQFYQEEARLLTEAIEEGIALGIFTPVDPAQTASFISGYLDGMMVRTVIQPDFSLEETLEDFKRMLWQLLGYRTAKTERRRASS